MTDPWLTIFAAPRPFDGEFDRIQTNAIVSWASLDPRPEILLFGEGSTRIAAHVTLLPGVEASRTGAPILADLFHRAQGHGRGELFAYVNPDVILLQDLVPVIEALRSRLSHFVVVGAPWNVPLPSWIDTADERWSADLIAAKRTGTPPARGSGADLFVFSRGAFDPVLPLAVGRLGWDNWLLWRAAANRSPAVDVTDAVTLIHQDHSGTTHRGSVGVTHEAFEEDVAANLAQLRWYEKIARRSEIPYRLSADRQLHRRSPLGHAGVVCRLGARHLRLKATPFLERAGLMRLLLSVHARLRKAGRTA